MHAIHKVTNEWPAKPPARLARAMSRFGVRNYLYGLPWFLLLFLATFSLSPTSSVQPEQGGILKAITIFVYSLSLAFLLVNANAVVSILRGRWLYVGFMAYISLSIVWSDDPASALRISAYFWGGGVVALVAVMAYRNDPRKFFQALVFYSVLMVGGSLWLVLMNPAQGIGDGGRWIGVTTHANGLGIISIISVWANISYFCLTRSKRVKAFNVLMIGLSALAIYGANSATSLVVSAAILVLTLMLRSVDKAAISKLFARAATMGLFIALCLWMAHALVPELFDVNAVFGIVGRDATFTGRTALWQMGVEKISQEPILGAGFQEFIRIAGVQMKHFHSGYIELLVRGGIVALFFVVAFVFQIIFSLKRTSDSRLYVFFTLMALAIVIHNVTEGSFGRGVNAFWLIFSFIYFFTDARHRTPPPWGSAHKGNVGTA